MSVTPLDASRYDELPYESRFFTATHPDRLATMAVLHGLNPPGVGRCRVLELGCADGGNLVAMAQTLPGATFLGVDFSPRQVAQGVAQIARLGLTNVELRAMSLAEIDDSFGQFDYIVCHGVYSWVGAETRAKILDVCARNLVRDGVAYVSYNTYPGWHARGMVREMMVYHDAGLPPGTDAPRRIAEARALLEFLARSATPAEGFHALALRSEAAQVRQNDDTYLFHEHLEPENRPFYFHEFAGDARAAGLIAFAQARFDIAESALAPAVRQAIARLSTDRVRREQYLDFVLNRTFRRSLLCRADRAPADAPLPDAVPRLRLTAMSRPQAPDPDVRSEAPVGFITVYNDQMTVGQPLLKAAVVALFQRWPRSAGFDELWSETLARLGRPAPDTTSADADADRRGFATVLLQGHMANLLDMHTFEVSFTATPAPQARPTSTPSRPTG
jgi:SAM-dependent methyltransferase